LTSNPIMSASSSPKRFGWKLPMRGRGRCLAAARSQVFRSSRCLIDLITEGSELLNSMQLAEFEHVAGRNAAGCAMENIAIDNRSKLRHRQLVVSTHQILDLEATVLADGLQRRDDVGDVAAARERQQQPPLRNDSPVDCIANGAAIDGKPPWH